MGKASSSKKVARAARAGAGSVTGQRRALGFPVALALIVLLGSSLVLFARGNRSEAVPPRLGDHWHAAYAIWNCDRWEPPLFGSQDPYGIHSHDDGVIHIHPFTSSVAGTRARMGVFFDTFGVEASADSIRLPGGTELVAGTECDGQEAVLKVVRWPAPASDTALEPEIIRSDFGNIRFLEDQEAFTIALVPEGADVPRPETIPLAAALSGQVPVEPGDAPTTPAPYDGADDDGAHDDGAHDDGGESTASEAGAPTTTAG